MLIQARKVAVSILVLLALAIPVYAQIILRPSPGSNGDLQVRTGIPVCDIASPHVTRWKKLLGIDQYHIELRCAQSPDFDTNILGASSTYVESRTVDMYLSPRLKMEQIEEVVIHELLHVLLVHMEKSDSITIHEQTVRTLVKAILRKG